MALETGTYIDDLVSSNPPQSDSLTQAAGHLRLIKALLLATFPNISGAMTKTHTELNDTVATVAAAQFIPAGSWTGFAGSSLPTGYLWCDGSAVNRTTYSALFSAIGTTYGVGDGATTFNLPNFKDRFIIGRATMGGTADAAIIDSLLTSTTLGATYDGEGAIDTITLAEANIPAHTHSLAGLALSGTTDAGGSHTHTVSGTTSSDGDHNHTIFNAGGTVNRGSDGPDTAVADSSSGDTSSDGSHTHTVTGTAASGGSHTHTFSGTTSAGTSGSTGSTTAFTVAILPPCIVQNFIIKT